MGKNKQGRNRGTLRIGRLLAKKEKKRKIHPFIEVTNQQGESIRHIKPQWREMDWNPKTQQMESTGNVLDRSNKLNLVD